VTNILLASVLAVNIGFLLFSGVFLYRLYLIYSQFKMFVSPKAENQTSPLADILQIVADMIGRSITASLKTTFMAKESADSRAQTAIEGDIAEGMLSQAGTIGSLLTSFPKLRKTLRRNPQLVDLALQMINKTNHSGSGVNEQAKFKL
jgi:hypothetical protein